MAALSLRFVYITGMYNRLHRISLKTERSDLSTSRSIDNIKMNSRPVNSHAIRLPFCPVLHNFQYLE